MRQQRAALSARIAADKATVAELEGKAALPDPDDVRTMRRALHDAGIGHAMLTDIVEVTDARWQGAVEGALRGFAFVALLDNPKDAPAAYRLGEQQRYGHFIATESASRRFTRSSMC